MANKQHLFQQSMRDRVEMAVQLKEIEERTGKEVKEEDMIKILEKAQEIQKKKNVKKRSMEEDFSKGSVRNQPCPMCSKKLKKCQCGFLL